MDEEKKSTPPKKKSLGILVMVLCIVLVAIILVVVIVASTGNGETTTSSGTVQTPQGTSSGSTTTPQGTSSVTPSTSSNTPSTTQQPSVVDPVKPTVYETVLTAPESGKVSLGKDGVTAGNLLFVDSTHPYTQSFRGGKDIDPDDVAKAGFYQLAVHAGLYKSNGYDAFMRIEAEKALAAMIQTFQSVAKNGDTFLVRSLTSQTATQTTSDFSTGNAVALYTWSNGTSYGLNYSLKKVTDGAKSVTYDKWFEAHAAEYGFYYVGLIGSDKNHQEGKLIYVGTIHAAGVKAAGGLDKYLAGIKDGSITEVTAADGTKWSLKYVAAAEEGATEIEVGASAKYTVSGDNMGGFVVAFRAAS